MLSLFNQDMATQISSKVNVPEQFRSTHIQMRWVRLHRSIDVHVFYSLWQVSEATYVTENKRECKREPTDPFCYNLQLATCQNTLALHSLKYTKTFSFVLSRLQFFLLSSLFFLFSLFYLVQCSSFLLSKAQVYGRSHAEIVGSNPAWGMDVCLL